MIIARAHNLLIRIGREEMNWRVLKDSKVIIAFTLSFIFEIIGIIFALKNNDFWVIFVVFGILLTFYSANRANQLYRKK